MLRINGRMVRNEVDLLLGHACSLFDWEIRNYIDLLIYIFGYNELNTEGMCLIWY